MEVGMDEDEDWGRMNPGTPIDPRQDDIRQ